MPCVSVCRSAQFFDDAHVTLSRGAGAFRGLASGPCGATDVDRELNGEVLRCSKDVVGIAEPLQAFSASQRLSATAAS